MAPEKDCTQGVREASGPLQEWVREESQVTLTARSQQLQVEEFQGAQGRLEDRHRDCCCLRKAGEWTDTL